MRIHANSFSLQPHASTPMAAVHGITGQVSRTAGTLRLRYRLEGELNFLRIPEAQASGFADELWRHTCFEAFVAVRAGGPYHEFNFSPSGQWAVYAFAGYRERVPLPVGVDLARLEPQLTVQGGADRMELEAVVPLAPLLQPADGPLILGISAVVEARDGTLAYWALAHPGAKPDFHHSDAFVLELDEIRH